MLRQRRILRRQIGAALFFLALYLIYRYRTRPIVIERNHRGGPLLNTASDHDDEETLVEGFSHLVSEGARLQDFRQNARAAQASPSIIPKHVRKMIVMAKTAAEDTDWVRRELRGWERSIYSWDDLEGETIPLMDDKGREANAYLTYLIEHYDDLADVVVFLHAHRGGAERGWHIDNPAFDNVVSVRKLRLETVLQEGYVNLRCQFTPGCPAMFDRRYPSAPDDPHKLYEDAFLATWPALFPNETLPEMLGVACCAQFAVSKKQIRERPKSDYERYRQWLRETEYDDHLAGTMLEYMWHVIFGRDALHCPDIWECYCEVFGDECYVIENIGLG